MIIKNMIVTSEARQHLANGARLAKMTHPTMKLGGRPWRIYYLKYAHRDGIEIATRVGTALEKSGVPVETWRWDR